MNARRSGLPDTTATMLSAAEATGIAHSTRVAVRDVRPAGCAASTIAARISVMASNAAVPVRTTMTCPGSQSSVGAELDRFDGQEKGSSMLLSGS
jgi:hypothetical protein